MDKLTIRQKLYLIFGILILFFVGNGVYSAYSLSQVNDTTMRIATGHLQGILTVADSHSALASYRQGEYAAVTATTVPERVRAILETKKIGDQMDIKLDAIEPSMSGDAADTFRTLREEWAQYRKETEEVIALARTHQRDAAISRLQKNAGAYHSIDTQLSTLMDNRKDFIHRENVNAAAEYQRTKYLLMGSILFVLLLSLGMARYLAGSIGSSVGYLMEVSREVAQGNLRVEVEPKTQDEIGQLTAAYRDTVENLHGLIKNIKTTAEQVSSFAAQLTENANQSAQATQQVAVSIGNVAASTSQQGDSVSESTRSIRTMAEDLNGFADKAKASSTAAHHVETIAVDGKKSIDGAVAQMGQIADSVNESAAVIEKLARRSKEIGQISDTISGIADQTNLLALNAAIEAARAGDAGRGFSVVAEEVRKLAEESGNAASQIAALIASIQQDTDQAVARMKQGTKDVKSGSAVMTEAGQAFEKINEAVVSLTQHSEDILNAAHASVEKADQMVAVMEGINASGKDVAAETESVSAATEEQSASMDEVAEASRKLADLAGNLQQSTAQFQI